MQPLAQPQAFQKQQDEINLLDIWNILLRHKTVIFLTFTICIAAGTSYAFLKTPVYESTAQLSIGKITNDLTKSSFPLENPEELESRLLSAFGKNVAEGIQRERPFLAKAGFRKDGSTTLELTVEGNTPDDAKNFLNKIAKDVLKEHKGIFDDNLNQLSSRIQYLAAQRSLLQKQYDDISILLTKLSDQRTVEASLLMVARGPIAQALNQQDAERLRLTQQTLAPQTRPSAVLGEITAPRAPSHPKKSLVLAVSAVLGLMMSIMLAFTAEFFSRAKEQKR